MLKRTSASRLLIVSGPVAWVSAFALVWVFATAFSCSAQGANCLSVRALDSKKGKPLKNLSITIRLRRPWISNEKTATTDSTGIARFCLSDPVPTYLRLSLDGKFLQSCSGYTFKTDLILTTGYLAPGTQCEDGSFEFTENAKPGELVILVKHRGWWERNFGDWH